MTSHMMVHCPLQTNVCGICEKTFKRSYDLRKHEITHTAEHHQVHARSRAVIYKELQLPLPTEVQAHSLQPDGTTPTVKSSRSYKIPRGRSTDAISTSVGHSRRGNSISSTRSSPYERTPVSESSKPFSNHRSESNLQLSYSSGFSGAITPIQQDLESDFSNGPHFQFVDDYSNSSGSPSSRTSNQLVFPSQNPQVFMDFNQPFGTDYASSFNSNNMHRYFNELHDIRRASQPTFLMPEPPNHLSGAMPPDSYRTGSLPTNSLYPNMVLNQNQTHNTFSQLVAEEQARDSIADFSFLNISSQEQQVNNYLYSSVPENQQNMWTNQIAPQEAFDLLFAPSITNDQVGQPQEQQTPDAFGLTPILDQVTQLADHGSHFGQYFAAGDDQNTTENNQFTQNYDLFPLSNYS
ncbi:hypothetical protein DFH28DRAFT_446233 [Melampsora americana]|nr:hypothetical protein DFH28DRAFT_446233 [Melampsora americana]